MTISEALRGGIRALNGRKRLWFWFYGVTTIWAVAIAAPAIGVLFASLGESAWAERMAGNFDLQWIAEVAAQKGTLPFLPLWVTAAAVFAISAVAHVFLLGGAIQLFCAREEFTLGGFFQGCGRHFWRFVRLALVSGLFYAVVGVVNRGMARVGDKIWGEGSEQTPLVYWGWGRTAVLLTLLGLTGLIFDYARIRLVASDSRKAFRAAFASVRFVFANFRKTAGLYAAVWAIALALLAAYYGVSRAVTQTSLGLVVLLFAIRQAMVLAKGWTQLLFYASQAEMYAGLTPVPVVEAAVVVEVEVPAVAPEPVAEAEMYAAPPPVVVEAPAVATAPLPDGVPFGPGSGSESEAAPEPVAEAHVVAVVEVVAAPAPEVEVPAVAPEPEAPVSGP